MNDIFKAGYQAYVDGKRLRENPFVYTDPNQFEDFTEWRKGYFAAEKELNNKY